VRVLPMKRCTYCKTEALDNAIKCSHCGSAEFIYKCYQCGTEFDSPFCPSCGIKAGEQAKTCPNCGEKCFDIYCPKCGTDLSNKQKNIDTTYHEHASTFINISNGSFSASPVAPPRPLRRKKSRAPLILLFILLFTGAVVFAFGRTDMEKEVKMVMKEGHPLYYGNIKDAITFFRGNDDIKIMQKGDTEYTGNDTLVITSIYPDSDIIGDIYFDFSLLQKSEEYSIDDMLNIICDYIPFDIVNQYYDFEESFMEESPEGDFVGYYYIMKLNNKGKALKSELYEDIFAFKILRDQHYNWEMEISSKSGESTGYPKKKWDIGVIDSSNFNNDNNSK
jgi:hypothetical protein